MEEGRNSLKRKAGDGLGKRKRLDGGGRSVKHPEIEILLPSWIKERREKKGARVTIKEVQKKSMAILKD